MAANTLNRIYFIFICLLLPFASFAQKQLWGMSRASGATNGAIFKTDSAGNNYTDVYLFNNVMNGVEPYGSLMQAKDGKLYGMTAEGGLYGYGVIFQLDPVTGTYVKKHDFDSINGKRPLGALCQASNGKLYGMTSAGGIVVSQWVADKGILFEYDPATNILSKKIDLISKNAANAHGALVQGADGKLYGLTKVGGGDATGMLFTYDVNTQSLDHQASFIAGPPWQGYHPLGSLVQGGNGHFYGFSQFGAAGASGGGVVFSYNPAGQFGNKMESLHKFDETAPGDTNGHGLTGTPVIAANGKLYGMTNFGGSKNAGVIFVIDIATNSFQKVHDFDSTAEGYTPYGSLMQASDGKLYGMLTSEGGQARLFSYDITTNTITIKANVTGMPYYTTLLETGVIKTDVGAVVIQHGISVYPNPAWDKLYIGIEDIHKDMQLHLVNAEGRAVIDCPLSQNLSVDVSSLPAAVYFLKLSVNGQNTGTQQVTICR